MIELDTQRCRTRQPVSFFASSHLHTQNMYLHIAHVAALRLQPMPIMRLAPGSVALPNSSKPVVCLQHSHYASKQPRSRFLVGSVPPDHSTVNHHCHTSCCRRPRAVKVSNATALKSCGFSNLCDHLLQQASSGAACYLTLILGPQSSRLAPIQAR